MKTTQVYTSENWAADGTFKATIGQIVADDVVAQLRDSVPPQTMQRGLLQIGEAYSHDYDGAPLYTTFSKTADGWMFCGHCLNLETENRMGWSELAAFIHELEIEICDNFMPCGGYLGDCFSDDSRAVATIIAEEIAGCSMWRDWLNEATLWQWSDRLGRCVCTVISRWLGQNCAPLAKFAALSLDPGEVWTICNEIAESTWDHLAEMAKDRAES